MAITTLDSLLAACPGQKFSGSKIVTPQTVGGYTGLLRKAGLPGAAVAPSSGVNGSVPTDSLSGAFSFTNPTGGNKTYLISYAAAAQQIGTLFIYDRLWENSGLNITTVGAQAISPTALTRFTSGVGVEAWLEVVTNIGANTTAVTIVYTNSAGTTLRAGTSAPLTASSTADRMYPFTLQAGDLGVQAITSYNNVATKTSGTISLVLRKRLASIVVATIGSGDVLDPFELGMVEIPDDACLEFIWLPSSVTATYLTFDYTLVQG